MFSSHPFTPPKLSAYVDEAKTYAAEHTLQTLGIPTEGGDAVATAATATTATVFPGTGEGGSFVPETAAAECLGTPSFRSLNFNSSDLHLVPMGKIWGTESD